VPAQGVVDAVLGADGKNIVSRRGIDLDGILQGLARQVQVVLHDVGFSQPCKRQKQAKQDAIMQKEKEAADLKKKYFGPEGELFKKRESLMSPIQDEIYNAVKEVSELRGYQLVLDRASDNGIIFASPKIDISNEVLSKLGY
jgi:Skp family chaperone for outer membrane proteins